MAFVDVSSQLDGISMSAYVGEKEGPSPRVRRQLPTRLGAMALIVPLLIAGVSCGEVASEEGATDFTAEDAVLCRELGGGWIHIRYERSGQRGWMTGTDLPDPIGGPSISLESDEEDTEGLRARERNGWDDAAIEELHRPSPAPDVEARLHEMPSCLDAPRKDRSG